MQLAFILGSHKYFIATEDNDVAPLVSNAKLSGTFAFQVGQLQLLLNGVPEYYALLARDLDVVEAKTPEDIYKQVLPFPCSGHNCLACCD